MKTVVQTFGICALTVLALSLTVNGRPVFETVYSVLSHITIPIQDATESLMASAFQSGQEYSKKLFYNSVPKVRDAVKSRASAPSRFSSTAGNIAAEPKEEILADEKEELDELIKSHH